MVNKVLMTEYRWGILLLGLKVKSYWRAQLSVTVALGCVCDGNQYWSRGVSCAWHYDFRSSNDDCLDGLAICRCLEARLTRRLRFIRRRRDIERMDGRLNDRMKGELGEGRWTSLIW